MPFAATIANCSQLVFSNWIKGSSFSPSLLSNLTLFFDIKLFSDFYGPQDKTKIPQQEHS
jgi:hypothetical protein